jgi:hypothetical protein
MECCREQESGTLIRGGYVDPNEVGLSASLVKRITKWLLDYENAHYYQFLGKTENERLDQEGVATTLLIRGELPGTQVDYFSNAQMQKIAVI